MSFDSKVIAGVKKALAKVGRDTVLRTYPNAVKPFATGAVVLGDPVDFTVRMSAPLNFSKDLVNGQTILTGDCYVIMDNPGFEPTTSMEILTSGKTWGIVNVETYTAQHEVVAYQAQLRIGR